MIEFDIYNMKHVYSVLINIQYQYSLISEFCRLILIEDGNVYTP